MDLEPLTSRHPAPLDRFPSTARLLLTTLNREGPSAIDSLAAAVGVSESAIRQRLAPLLAEGLVEYVEASSGAGRRRRLYSLTEHGLDLFPQAYDRFALGLMRFLSERAPEVLAAYFEETPRIRIESESRRLAFLPFESRAAALPEMLGRDRYLCEHGMRGDDHELAIHHCPILRLAREYPAVCQAERDLLRGLFPDGEVSRTAHRPTGDTNCAYRFERVRGGGTR